MAEFKDYYATLGVPKTADQDEIRRAYRKLARQYHPDVNKDPGAEERFKEVGEAYTVLSDPEKRQVYDQYGTAQAPPPPPPGGWRYESSVEGVDPEVFSEFFQGLFGGGDAFETIFGGQRATRGPRRGTDYSSELVLPLERAYRGGDEVLDIGGEVFTVTIPQGVRDGSRIRLAGKGSPGSPPGDLYLTVRLAEHPRFRLEGSDIHTTVDVPAPVAVVGGRVRAPTLDGPVELTVPPRSKTGRRLRLRGKGWPKAGGGQGDLYAELRVTVPERPSPEEERLYRELAKLTEGVVR
jgi:curved DNA-binding protein